jgi:hypothetical protein
MLNSDVLDDSSNPKQKPLGAVTVLRTMVMDMMVMDVKRRPSKSLTLLPVRYCFFWVSFRSKNGLIRDNDCKPWLCHVSLKKNIIKGTITD